MWAAPGAPGQPRGGVWGTLEGHGAGLVFGIRNGGLGRDRRLPGTCLEPSKSLLDSENGEERNCSSRRCLTAWFHSL